MPPAAFFSLIARSTASFSAAPVAAASPVNGPNTPILIVSADALIADPIISAEASKPARRTRLFSPVMFVLPFMGGAHFLRRRRCPTLLVGLQFPIFPAEIARPDLRIFQKIGSCIGKDNPARLDNQAARRHFHRDVRVLTHQKNCCPVVMKPVERVRHFFHKYRREAERRLVQ